MWALGGGIRTWDLGQRGEGTTHPGQRQGGQVSRLAGKGLHSASGHVSEVPPRSVGARGPWHLNCRSPEGLSIQVSIWKALSERWPVEKVSPQEACVD